MVSAERAGFRLMQDEDRELSNLSSETIQKAIDAVRAQAWDINPFTVADELKVSRSAIYRHAEIMKLIIAARGGDFGMDVQTSSDLTWQLRQLELQNNELKERLAISGSQKTSSHKANVSIKPSEEISDNLTLVKNKETDKAEEVTFNFANNGPQMSDYFNQLAHMSWKDIETVYYFKVSSLKDYAKNLLSVDAKLRLTSGESMENALAPGAISYGSLISLEANKGNKQALSISPFARLKGGSLPNQIERDPGSGQSVKGQTFGKILNQAGIEVPPAIKPSSLPIGTIKLEEVVLPLERLTGSHPIIEPEKPVDKSDTEISRVVAELHKDLASKIRAGLGDTGNHLAVPETPIPPDSAPAEIKLISLLKDKPIMPQSSVPLKNSQTDTGDMAIQEKRESSIEEKPSGSGDELRDLIQSHIRTTAEQMAEFSHGYSIGSGKEFEVWLNNPARSKFVGSTKSSESPIVEEADVKTPPKNFPFKPRVVPPDVRKACLILGVRPDNITYEIAQESWKRAIAAPGVHPDQGGDTELAVYLNTAKDVLMRFLDAQAPKLGKKFGPFKVEKIIKPKADKPKDEQ